LSIAAAPRAAPTPDAPGARVPARSPGAATPRTRGAGTRPGDLPSAAPRGGACHGPQGAGDSPSPARPPQEYNNESSPQFAREIADEVKRVLAGEGWDRYKIVVQCVIGEHGGQGTRMGARCFWDAKTDNLAEEMYSNESLFALTAAFGVYYY